MKLYFDEFEFEPEQCELRRAGRTLKVDPLVLRLLEVLVRNAGKIVTKQELLDQVWSGRAAAENVITITMVRLRKALGQTPGKFEFVKTVHGQGYRFVAPITMLRQPSAAGAAGRLARLPFVGRERVLQSLHVALAQVSATAGRAWVLSGEPGIGKTCLIEQFERELIQSDTPVCWGQCYESGDTPPLWPFGQILRQVFTWSAKQPHDLGGLEWARRVPELTALLPELARHDVNDAHAFSWGARSKQRVFDAIVQICSRAAERRAFVVVLDDLHRADAATLDLLQTFVDQLARTKILLLAMLNRLDLPLATARAQLAYFYGHRNTTRVILPRLSEHEVSNYVSALCEDQEGALSRVVFEKSEGHPFFMSELTQQLVDAPRARASDLAVSAEALDLMRRRLAILDDEARGALSCAAVIGRRFELPVLQAVSGQEVGSLRRALDSAIARLVIVAEGDSQTAFTFGHELLRVALYEALTPAQRRSLHWRVACVLEERLAATSSLSVADLAFHSHAALPDGDLSKTVQHCRAAATESAKLFAYSDALRYLRHALAAIDLLDRPSPRLRLNVLMFAALCARTGGDLEYESLARELIRLAREHGAGRHIAWGAFLLDLNTGYPPLAGARDALEAGLRALPTDDDVTRSGVLARLATLAPLAYDAAASGEQVARALELARRSNVPVAMYHPRTAQLYLHGGSLDQSIANEAFAALELLCQQHPFELTVPPALLELHRAIRALQAGDLAVLATALDQCQTLCRRLGNRELGWHVERARTVQRINLRAENPGEHARAIQELAVLHARAATEKLPGSALFRAYDACLIAPEIAPLTGSELMTALEQDAADAPNIWSMKLRALAAAGHHDEARARLRQFTPEQIMQLPRDRDYLGTIGALVQVALALSAIEYFEVLSTRLTDYPTSFAAHVTFLCEGSSPELRARIAHRLGREPEARELTAQSHVLSARTGLPRRD